MKGTFPSTCLSKVYNRTLLQAFLFAVLVFVPCQLWSQNVPVGLGSYSTVIPSGESGPQDFQGKSISPKVSETFSLPIQTNDFWSSLIYPFFKNPHSNILYAHPLNLKAVANGLELGYTDTHIFAANDFLYPYAAHLTVSVNGLSATQTQTQHYGDWTVTAFWKDSNQSMEATMGHGLPFAFFKIDGGDAVISTIQTPTIWYQQGEVLGITVKGKHYGIFAPSGSTWTGTNQLQSSLNGKSFFSIALLPDNTATTLDWFRSHAYAFVNDSRVNWIYDEKTATLTSTYSYETVLMDSSAGNLDETVTALYRHQWLNTTQMLTDYSYQSPRGEMKLSAGNSFMTQWSFSGILPALPDLGDYNRADLLNLVKEAAKETLPITPTYENGKSMARFSHLVHIADQLGAVEERDHFLTQIKLRLEDWFTAGGKQQYVYNDQWDVLTGYPSGFGADNQINDHHFHASYAIMSAVTIARYDSVWAAPDHWGGMVNLLIKDANNWDREDTMFPFLRSYDAYAGHSWAAGHGDFAEGNNQESSSESMNFASAAILWGEATQQPEIRDLGIFLYTTETAAVEQYWFDIDDVNFPTDYPHIAIGMVWGGKGVHSTWFGADPEFIHGINILPVTSASVYLGRHPDFILKNYNEVVAERNGQPAKWQDILWQYLAMSDPNLALSYYYSNPDYEPFDGESRAHTLHWLYNMKKMGQLDTTIFADVPTYSVFKNTAGDTTWVAYNSGSVERTVNFSDGTRLIVAPRQMVSASSSIENPDEPVALLLASKTSGKAPLTVRFSGSKSFDRNGSGLQYLWDFGDSVTAPVADTSHVFTKTGTFKVTLTVTNNQSLSKTDSIYITVLGNGTPFSGTPIVVPAKIEAENFDKGGEGVAYHDAEAANIGLAYRPSEGVDVEGANDGGFDVYWITAGEWLEYTFKVTEAGNYNFIPYVATIPGFGNFTLFIDNIDVSGKKAVKNTGGWQFWSPIEISKVPMEAGVHIMRFEFDSDTDKNGWLFSMNYIQITKSSAVGVNADEQLPNEYQLSQNYPNPFNPHTTIRFALPVESAVTIRIYNLLGQEVATLINNQVMVAGNHVIEWNGKSDGFPLTSGIYFYRIEASDFIKTKIMTLLK